MVDGLSMRAAVLDDIRSIELRDVDRPTPAADEVLVEVGVCGVCMTDYHIYHGTFPVQTPVVLGHEAAGEVAEVGEEVAAVEIGDRVALNPAITCGHCRYCKRGQPNQCENMISTGGAGDDVRNGSFAEYIAVPQRAVEPIGDIAVESAALAEPYACCIHGVDRSRMQSGDSVAIVGAGPIGLLLVQEFRHRGAGEIVVSEIDADRRDIALDFGADAVVDPRETDPVEAVRDELGVVDVAAEVVGTVETIEQTHAMTSKGGTTLVFGVPPQNTSIEIDPFEVYYDEIDLLGTYGLTPDSFRRAIVGLQCGRVDADRLVTERVGLDKLELAFKRMERVEGLKKQIVL